MRSRILAKAEAVESGWIGNALGSGGIIATGAAPTEEEVQDKRQDSIEDYLASQATYWLHKMGYAGSPDVLNCPEGAIKLPIDIWICKIAQQTCPIQAQVFVNDPERFFAGCVLDEEHKQDIFKAVKEQSGAFDHMRGRYLCTRCEDENGCESSLNYHYPWELSSLEDFAPFVGNRDMPEVVRKLIGARIPRSAVHNALCARHSIEICALLYPEAAANLRVLEFEIALPGAKVGPLPGEELPSEV